MTIDVRPDFKPAARKVASQGEWTQIVAEKVGPCRGCGKPYGPGSSFHHLVPRSLRGDDVPANIVVLCGSGTTGCHGTLETHPAGWEQIAAAVRHSLTPLERQYVAAKKGLKWLDRYYPAGDHDLCARCRKPKSTNPTTPTPRKRRTWSCRPPADTENGCELLDTLVDQCRQELGRGEGTDPYYVLTEVMYFFLTAPKERAA